MDTDTIDDHALRVLEFPEFLALVAEYAGTQDGKRWIRELRPLAGMSAIAARHDLLRDILTQFESGLSFPRPIFAIPASLLRRTRPAGAILSGEDLLEFRGHLEAVKHVHHFVMHETEPGLVRLQELAGRLNTCAEISAALQRSLDEKGHLYDGASTALGNVRSRIRQHESGIHAKLQNLFAQTALQGVFQDHFITLRKDRYVIPVKREMKARLRGVVHDHSDSGQTLFVEPEEVLDDGNELAEFRVEERDECRRLLRILTAKVRCSLDQIRANIQILTELDGAVGVARWARTFSCSFPTFSSRFRLFQARHPLLERQFRQDKARRLVPIDVDLADRPQVVAITGSNSGGKTVVLKTVGLLTLAAHTGLPIPARPDSEVQLIDQVFADIGDEQSISENISTFTGHMQNITYILRQINQGGKSLVLLDELGSGTDPLEGGALACSILHELTQSGALSVVTTHLGVVKTFVHEQSAMVNAAMRFNPENLRPEYILEMGRPGASHALTIAEKVGLPGTVLQGARSLLGSDQMRLESVIAALEEEKRQAEQKEHEVKSEVGTLQKDRERLRQEVDTLHQQRERVLHDAYREASQTVANTRKQMDRLLQQLKKSVSASNAQDRGAAELQEEVREKAADLERAARASAPSPPQPVAVEQVQTGAVVWVEKLREHGRIVHIDPAGKRVIVACGAVHFSVAVDELGKPAKGQQQSLSQQAKPRFHAPQRRRKPECELNLHGYTVDEAVPAVDKFLNQAVLDGLNEVRIIHGYGTGRLQKGLHEYLNTHKLAVRYRLGDSLKEQGGAAVTVVTLAES